MNPETDRLLQILRSAGMRVTAQRVAICDLLVESSEHPTAQQIFENLRSRYSSLSLATVYNTLETLVSLGVVNELGSVGDEAIHYDADLSPHVNLACLACHRVIDLPSAHIQQVAEEVEGASGYRLLGARVLYYGLCPECSGQRSADS
jgi:Fur family transcriptional regulator, peroxide stress response regulator